MQRLLVRSAGRNSSNYLLFAVTLSVLGSSGSAWAEPRTERERKPKVEWVSTLEGPADLVRFSHDGSKIVTAGKRWARIWDARTFKPLTPPLDHGADVTSVEFGGRDAQLLLTLGADSVRVWEAQSGKPASPRVRHGPDSTIRNATLSPDGQRVLTVADEPRDPRPGIKIMPVNAPMPDTTLERRSVRVWDRATGELTLSLEHASFVSYAEFSPEGKRILTVCAMLGGSAYLWDAADGKRVAAIEKDVIRGMPAGAFSRDGNRFALTGWYQVTVHSTEDGKQIAKIDDFGHEHEDLPTGVALSPNGNTLLAASQLHDVRVWNVATGKRTGEELHEMKDIEGVAFGPNGEDAFALGYDFQGAGLWNIKDGKQLWAVPKDLRNVRAGRFEPNGSVWIVCANREGADIYKLVR